MEMIFPKAEFLMTQKKIIFNLIEMILNSRYILLTITERIGMKKQINITRLSFIDTQTYRILTYHRILLKRTKTFRSRW